VKEEGHLFGNRQTAKKALLGFYIFLVLLIVADLIIPKHAFFPWEKFPSFYGAYGFVAYVTIVYGSNYILRKLLKRKEDYYDD